MVQEEKKERERERVSNEEAQKEKDTVGAKEPTKEEIRAMLLAELKKNIATLEKSVQTKETRLIGRVLRTISSTRRRVNVSVLSQVLREAFPPQLAQHRDSLLADLHAVQPQEEQEAATDMEVESPNAPSSSSSSSSQKEAKPPTRLLPEAEIYLHLLVTIFLIDKKHFEKAAANAIRMVERLHEFNRITLNPLSAKVYFYYSYVHELLNKLEEIRSNLLAYHRTASLRHNEEAQATLLNLLLRNYLHYSLYDQADKLLSKTTFREDVAPSNQHARYLYYQGKIKSVQLDYTEAYKCLLGAIRKAPQTSAKGFRLSVYKLACIVQLLMGEIPDRSVFRQPGLKVSLDPYLQLTRAVRVGDLVAFHQVVNKFGNLFRKDLTYTLIQRLHHNVIKTGLRKINLAYSRISFADICSKLHLESVEDAEFIVAKAVRDGVISAQIDHQNKCIHSKEDIDIYSTLEPQKVFHRRISFCLNTHNEAVKAMRYPPNAHKANHETAKERREREQEIAKNLVEEEDEY